jgi:hypothetical protein
MLPDYPAIKEKMNRRLRQILKATQHRHLGPFAQIKEIHVPEGHGTTLTREDGSKESVSFEHVQVMAELKGDPEKCTAGDLVGVMNELAEKLADERIKQFFDVTNRAVKQVGNDLKREPGESTVDSIFRSLEGVWIDFNDDGTPRLPTLLAGKATADSLAKAFSDIETMPELRRRYDDIMERKREEWRARESARNMVG